MNVAHALFVNKILIKATADHDAGILIMKYKLVNANHHIHKLFSSVWRPNYPTVINLVNWFQTLLLALS